MLVLKRKRYLIFKWFAGILLFFSFIAVGISWYVSVKLRPLANEQLRSFVFNATDSLYRIDFKSIHINLITGNATLNDVVVTPDTVRFKKLIDLKRAPNNLYYISLRKLVFRDFHPQTLYRNRKLDVDLLLLEKPDISMVNRQFDFNEDRPPRPIKSPYDYISKLLKEIRIQAISFKNISFKYVDNNGSSPQADSVANLNITLKDLLIDKRSAADTSRLYLLKDIDINLNDYSYATPDSMYTINLNQLDFTASSGKLNIKKFSLQPRYSEMQFGKVAGYARERFDIQMSDISLNGLDLPVYIRKQEVKANEMTIANGFVSVFNNNALTKRKTSKIGRYPQQLLQKVRIPIAVKRINLQNIDISYAEFDKESGQKGKISFERTSGTIMDVTNIAKIKRQNPVMVANLNSYVMGSGKLNVQFKFNLATDNGAFFYEGTLSNMDGRLMNRITKPLGMVRVNKGDIKKLIFSVDANDYSAKGKVSFAYNDLSVALMKKDAERNKLVKQGLLSFLANALIINSDNPNQLGQFTEAAVNYKRAETASFFNFIWRTLFQGIKYSVGITPEKEHKIRRQIAEFEQRRMERIERKKHRQKRKEQRVKERIEASQAALE